MLYYILQDTRLYSSALIYNISILIFEDSIDSILLSFILEAEEPSEWLGIALVQRPWVKADKSKKDAGALRYICSAQLTVALFY